MPRATKSQGKKSRASEERSRDPRTLDRVLMRRYLAFVRAVVGGSTKPATR